MKPMRSNLEALSFWQKILVRGMKETEFDLSPRQMGVMLSVYLSNTPHSVKSLSETLKVSKPAICRAVDALSLEGLIRRKIDEKDRRNVFIQRTVKGSVFLAEFGDIILAETQTKDKPEMEVA